MLSYTGMILYMTKFYILNLVLFRTQITMELSLYMKFNKPPVLFLLLFSILFFSITLSATPKLVFASIIFRHGDRTPTTKLPNSPFDWKYGLGELTPRGMHQEFELGKTYRKKFIEFGKLLPYNFDINQIYVRSTDLNRTLMSAQSFLTGLYPPGTGPFLANYRAALQERIQPVPIHSVKKSNDILLHSQGVYKKQLNVLFKKHVYSTKEWIDMENSVKKYFNNWSEISGLKINNLENVKKFANNIYVRTIHDIDLPKGLSQQEITILIMLSSWIHAQQFKPEVIGELVAGHFIKKVQNDMNGFINNKGGFICYLYSAHDTNILAIMSALGMPLSTNPPYASHLMFGLYKYEHMYQVKMIYNETIYWQSTLSEFKKLMNN